MALRNVILGLMFVALIAVALGGFALVTKLAVGTTTVVVLILWIVDEWRC
ncbi:MAG TPA: hypothetical protein K8W06_04705 [Limosilactobacillus coleohominis]|nr:hypothetical protein [Limosilactobacillus coleohominis]